MAVINPEDQEQSSVEQPRQKTTRSTKPQKAAGTRVTRGLKRNQIGEAVGEFTKAMNKVLEGSSVPFDVNVIAMDGGTWSLHYSIAVLTATAQIGAEAVTAAYALILEGSNIKPAPVLQTMGNTQIDVVVTAMDAWEQGTYDKIIQAIQESLGVESPIVAGASVVPSEVNFSDEERLHEIVWSANEAIHSAFETNYPEAFAHVSIGSYVSATDRITVAAEFNNGESQAVTGLPVRSDIRLRMAVSESSSDADAFTDWQHRGTRELSEVSAFATPVFVGQQPHTDRGQPAPTELFIPQIVISQVQANDMPQTPETYFWTLATVALLGENYQWASQFTNFGQGSMHDIGGVGLRIQEVMNPRETPVPLDTSTNQFGEDQLSELLEKFVEADPVYCLDAEDAGPDSWLTSMFVESAANNENATQYLVAALDRLTDNNFSAIWSGCPLFESVDVRVHLGTYKNADGEICDLRNLDSLAWLNMVGHNDMNSVNDWEDTFDNTGIPQEVRLANRLDMINEQFGQNNVEVRGFAERLIINGEFLDTLVQALVNCGLAVDQHGLRPFYGNRCQSGNTYLRRHAHRSNGNAMVRQRGRNNNVRGRSRFSPFSR